MGLFTPLAPRTAIFFRPAWALALSLVSCIVPERTFQPIGGGGSSGAGGTSGSGGRGGTAGSAGAMAYSVQCDDYCTTAQANCTGEFQLYSGVTACLGTCAALPLGGDGMAPGTNTVACRAQQARNATTERSLYCRAAGPGGNQRAASPETPHCGSDCEAYCGLLEAVCAVSGEVSFQTADCLRFCEALPEAPATATLVEAQQGDTVQCRLRQLSEASVSPATARTSCWLARLVPDVQRGQWPVCADPELAPGNCAAYCSIAMAACRDNLAVYESEQQCLQACAVLPPGVTRDRDGADTVGCRRYHAYAAMVDAPLHCPHASVTADGHCGADNCPSHCQLLRGACPSAYSARFGGIDGGVAAGSDGGLTDAGDPSTAACVAACREVEGSEADSRFAVTSAATSTGLQCRTLHALRALARPDTPSECEAAMGGGQCAP